MAGLPRRRQGRRDNHHEEHRGLSLGRATRYCLPADSAFANCCSSGNDRTVAGKIASGITACPGAGTSKSDDIVMHHDLGADARCALDAAEPLPANVAIVGEAGSGQQGPRWPCCPPGCARVAWCSPSPRDKKIFPREPVTCASRLTLRRRSSVELRQYGCARGRLRSQRDGWSPIARHRRAAVASPRSSGWRPAC